MKTTKLGPNDRCPCGSGKKVKKCCKRQPTVVHYTAQDRAALFDELDCFIDELFQQEEEQAYDAFWGCFLDREDELPPEMLRASEDVQFMAFACHWELAPGVTALDRLLDRHPSLPLGARAFARTIRHSTMRLYEATSVVPGISITLRDILEGGSVTVAERTASRSVNQFDWLAARVVDRGPSGQPRANQRWSAVSFPSRLFITRAWRPSSGSCMQTPSQRAPSLRFMRSYRLSSTRFGSAACSSLASLRCTTPMAIPCSSPAFTSGS